MRGFTSISEKLNDPKKLIEFLNIYMTPMTEIITESNGTVDKFIGDAIMAYWNAPNDVENHADVAVQSAVKQIKELKKVNKKLESLGFPSIDIGIGINTGDVVVGEMGSSGRSDYTIIGDSVNLGSRTEGLCKTYKAQILITEFTKQKLKKEYNIEFVDEVKVKGKEKEVKIYKVTP
ncbi:MAG TPA: adenylate/guanylate cyclase domain-containing protein [Sulfurospirillum arcachonense]|nr:adenylate/guanylate cyclase domain-containing protein [Sulfurospirillum arcachonense]